MTTRPRLPAVLSLACAVFSLLSAAPAAAQDYPGKPIRIIVPLAAGGGADVLARVVAARLRDKFGQRVITNPAASYWAFMRQLGRSSPRSGFRHADRQPPSVRGRLALMLP